MFNTIFSIGIGSGESIHPGMSPTGRMVMRWTCSAWAVVFLAACAGSGPSTDGPTMSDFQEEQAEILRMEEINQRLLAATTALPQEDRLYRIGSEDQISVEIFGVSELSREYVIDGRGHINMPLVGEVAISGYTIPEAEQAIADAYSENYLRDPQVSIRVTEYRSQQFTAMGAVNSPRVYNTRRRVTLMEALAMAGGLSTAAGNHVYLTDRVRDPETGEMSTRSLIIKIEDLLRNTSEFSFLLGDSALINVPRAGSIFVEGAVQSPGVYTRHGDTTVLKAVAMAGGLRFEANRSRIRILSREPGSQQWEQRVVNYSEIRGDPTIDRPLRDGDIVMVEHGAIRSAWTGTLRAFRDIAFLGWRPLR
jgi:polysaccharide biosynthesis/export protein